MFPAVEFLSKTEIIQVDKTFISKYLADERQLLKTFSETNMRLRLTSKGKIGKKRKNNLNIFPCSA